MDTFSLLHKLVNIPSAFPNEKTLGDYLLHELTKRHFEVKSQQVARGRSNILAQKGSGPSLLLFGHLDTVPLTAGWTTDPFRITKEGDRLYALGAWDMKGGIASILSAVRDFEPNRFTLKLAFVVDEENISLGMHTLIRSGWLSDVVAAVAPEPGFVHGHNGITIGRTGRSLYRVVLKTKGGHVYLSRKRHNAIDQAYLFLEAVKRLKKIRHNYLGEFVVFPRYIHGGANAMSVPDEVEIELETQLGPPQTTESVLSLLQSVASKEKFGAVITIEPVKRPTPFCQPFIISKHSPFVRRIRKILGEVIKEKPVMYYRRSVADENRIASLGIPVVTIGPSGGNAHEPNEWVSEKSLSVIEQLLSQLLLSYNESGVQ